jgi:PAS domain S-box-containing protein
VSREREDASDDHVFRTLANAMPQLVWIARDDGVVEYYNSRAADYGGVRGDDGGYDWQPLVHPEDLDATLAAWSEAAATGAVYEYRHRILMADGSYRWHLSRAVSAYDPVAEAVKWFGTATDVHEPTVAEHHFAETAHVLQEALLPRELPTADRFRLAARYLPGTGGTEVGGDWFDAIADEDTLTLVIGDVAGHGIEAAAVMGAARHSVATLALSAASPSEVLAATNRYLTTVSGALATCLVARIDLGTRSVVMASAGHPPPVVAVSTAPPELLSVAPGPPLGAFEDAQYPSAMVEFADGATVVLYTDGLVERRGTALDQRLDELVRCVDRALRAGAGEPPILCEQLLRDLADGAADDIALLVAQLR